MNSPSAKARSRMSPAAAALPLGGPLDTRGSAIHPTIEFRVDDRRVKLFEIAGLSVGEAAFAGQPGPPTMDRFEISGPYNAKGVSETPSRQRIFVCRPASPEEEPACASRILSAIARRAFRRDVTAAEVKPFWPRYAAARRKQDFDESIAAAIRDVLLAPDFLFRLEFDPPGAAPGSAQKVSDWELASRLSFFLWSSIPDDELLDAAHSGKLRHKGGLDVQVRRMLADPARGHDGRQFAGTVAGAARPGGCQARPSSSIRNSTARLPPHSKRRRACSCAASSARTAAFSICSAPDYTYLNERLARITEFPASSGRASAACQLTAASGARRPARPGKHSAADVPHHQDIADPARQMDSRQPAELAAASASARRAAAR